MHYQSERRIDRMKSIFNFIKDNEPVGIEMINKEFPNLSLVTIKSYLKSFINMEALKVDNFRRYLTTGNFEWK